MLEWLHWITKMEYTKPIALVIFFVTFVAIILYVFSNKERSRRFESYKSIPLDDDEVDEKSNEQKQS